MQKINQILVPTDFSATANAAFKYANTICHQLSARLCVLHVIAPVYYVEAADLTALMHEAEKAADAALHKLKPTPSRALIERGTPHEVIVAAAGRVGADLIIMGTHGRSGIQRLVLGSVAENVLRHAPCPVLTLRSPSQSGRRP